MAQLMAFYTLFFFIKYQLYGCPERMEGISSSIKLVMWQLLALAYFAQGMEVASDICINLISVLKIHER
ncbi:hypothetical protein CWO92_08040 [Heyndrickxia camelliae]|uniref:Uncharacterized protein n=1 Tax=Heyndrickxia camelliae TaxID=1707093 RepID=A0A2N3LM01_9BACI|nr:hypothetical protein CWO92_08040 [Heyndrickxia camelliae]